MFLSYFDQIWRGVICCHFFSPKKAKREDLVNLASNWENIKNTVKYRYNAYFLNLIYCHELDTTCPWGSKKHELLLRKKKKLKNCPQKNKKAKDLLKKEKV
jgi:hypothetical protein